MRLIDADALIARWKAAMLHMTTVVDGKHPISIETLIEDVEKFPTIDPESLVPQGEWIDKPTGAYRRWQSWCSHCGKHSGIGGIESNRHKSYCPNCGAKMKGGADR